METMRNLKAQLAKSEKEIEEIGSWKEKLAASEQANEILKSEVRRSSLIVDVIQRASILALCTGHRHA